MEIAALGLSARPGADEQADRNARQMPGDAGRSLERDIDQANGAQEVAEPGQAPDVIVFER